MLPTASGLMALSTIAVTIAIIKIAWFQQIFLATALTFFPFLFAGIFISATFQLFAGRSPRIYAADLIGASFGAILAVLFLKMGGINTNLFVSFIASLPVGLLMYRNVFNKLQRMIACALIVGLFVIFLGNSFTHFLGEIPLGKGTHKEMMNSLDYPGSKARIIESRWSAFGRTDWVADENDPNEMALFIDGTAGTVMYRFDKNLRKLSVPELIQFPGNFPFELLPESQKEKILIIGSGGGREVLVALRGGAKEVTAVEVNKDLVDLMKKYSDFNGGIYNGFSGVKVVVEEGRNFIRKVKESYDIIMMSIPITKTSRSPEGFALTENFLFTVESINDYLDHLKPNGQLVVVAHHEVEIFRLVLTALAALKTRGIETPSAMKQIYTLGPEDSPIFVLKKSPFTLEEAQKIHLNMHKYDYSNASSFIPFIEQSIHPIPLGEKIYYEYIMLNPALYRMGKGEVTAEEIIRNANFEIKPVTDDTPFFYKFELGIPSVVTLLIIFSMIALLWGWCLKSRDNGGVNLARNNTLFLLLFSFLGIGFMLVEIPLIQKFILFLGQPVYAMAVLLFSLLVGAGVGSWASGSIWKRKILSKLWLASIIVALLIGVYILLLGRLFHLFLGFSFPIRVLISFSLLWPLGFWMGIPFPSGMKLLETMERSQHIPKLWGINGIGSVLGSSLAIAVAISFGFSYAMILGAILYFLIFILFAFLFRSSQNGVCRS